MNPMRPKSPASRLALLLLVLALLSGCARAGDNPIQSGSPAPADSQQQATPQPTPSPTPQPTPSPEPTHAYPLYTFGTPLEESAPVADDSFFDSAVFLGDSRTEGLQLFSGLKNGTFYWARGMTVFRADSDEYRVFQVDGQQLTLVDALAQRQYEAVYVMIGINELGYSPQRYEQGLAELIDKILAVQPSAVVYLQTLPPVNDAVARANGLADYINNTQVDLFNQAIVRVAAQKGVVLLDTASVYRGPDGQLPAELASDGAHFVFSGYARWADYLRCHVMDPERYFYNRALTSAGEEGSP